MYIYKEIEPNLFTVGYYDPSGNFKQESDHSNRESAAMRVSYLNGNKDAHLIKHPDCLDHSCSFYTHYLVFHDPDKNGPKMNHDAYHIAEKQCLKYQEKLLKWMDDNPDLTGKEFLNNPTYKRLEKIVLFWENKAVV